ncbi:MAG: helix-turn-helix domain-containing protein [Flavobacteriaceae bacterium]|nr:helix-turn-helix domain-containing protein [Flavobacteriaceae bacterium]
MLKTIQIIALIQGIFTVFVLLTYKKQKHKPAFWLLIGGIISVLLYLIGDDENNLFFEDVDWFFLDVTLFITFFFLFVKYFVSKADKFRKNDYLFFVPNIIFFIIEIVEDDEASLLFEMVELSIELIFLGYLIYTIVMVARIKHKRPTWLLYFLILLTIVLGTFIIDDLPFLFNMNFPFESFIPENSYILIMAAFLFYAITLKLIFSQKEFNLHLLIPDSSNMYVTSGLKLQKVETYKDQLLQLIEEQQLYKNTKLSINKVATELGIPRQYVSEILNVHMNTNFQDFINQYRVEAFIECLQKKQYEHFTLYGIANEVGFNSKSSFNATFKKIKGLTPTEYKKKLLTDSEMRLK